MKVTLITHTPEPEKVVACAAKLCYSASDISSLMDGLTADKVEAFIQKLTDLGHQSPLEHCTFTFGIEGVSRALSHQLVRHRIASYSQKSQRYVSEEQFDSVIPPSIASDEICGIVFRAFVESCFKVYQHLIRNGVPAEDARFVLPNACTTQIIVTMNIRSLLHFFEERCCNRAQWEIREMANEMLRICKTVAPNLFAKAGPSCVRGNCKEGPMCCGHPVKTLPELDEPKMHRDEVEREIDARLHELFSVYARGDRDIGEDLKLYVEHLSKRGDTNGTQDKHTP